jgi:hypothetical protein
MGSVRGGEKETAFETGRPDGFPGAYSGLCLGRAHQAHQGETTETGGGLRQAHAIEKVENPSSRLPNIYIYILSYYIIYISNNIIYITYIYRAMMCKCQKPGFLPYNPKS